VTLRGRLADQFIRAESGLASVLALADWISANSLNVLEQARRLLPGSCDRSSVIYDGLSAPAVPVTLPSFDPPRLLCLGRLSPEKGFDVALEAFAVLLGRFPTARLVVAGGGPERAALERRVGELKIAQSVEFVGWVAPDAVSALISKASLVVIPSWTESLPLVAAEAGQMERPTVATRVGGMPEVVVDGETGLLVEPGDSQALAAAIVSLLEHPERARELAAAARRHAERLFSLEGCVDSYDALYRRLISGGIGVGAR
jgi:glycosyltransferase involved in cell wall biosynthesis